MKNMNDPQHQIRSCSVSIYGMRLDYILHETRIAEEKRNSYSISIQKYADASREYVVAPDVSSIRSRAVDLFNRVVSGTVTPCTLLDVIEDLL